MDKHGHSAAATSVSGRVRPRGPRRPQFCTMSGVGTPVLLFSWVPTATTVPSLRAVTAKSALVAVPGSGLLMIVQLVPSQCSINFAVPLVVEKLPAPTAQMSLAEIAAIPYRAVSLVGTGFGFGLDTMLQLVPSQCSIAGSLCCL